MNRKIDEKSKYADEGKWFKEIMDYYVPFSSTLSEDYESLRTAYQIVNNDLSAFNEKIKKFCDPMGDNIAPIEDSEIEPYPELHNSLNILKGEMLGRKDNYNLVLLSSNAVKTKNDELKNLIKLSLDEKAAIDMQLQGITNPEDQKAYYESLRTQQEPEDLLNKDWRSELEIIHNRILKYAIFKENIIEKKVDSFEDVIVGDRSFVYSGWKFGRPYLEVRNPLFIDFQKSPNEKRVEKSDWIAYRKPITLAEAIEFYNLKEEEIERLGGFKAQVLDERHNIYNKAKPVFDKTLQDLTLSNTLGAEKTQGLNQTSSDGSELIWETHFEFKAFKKIIFITTRDEYNVSIVTPVSDFDIPKEAKKQSFLNRFDQMSEKYSWIDSLTGEFIEAEILYIPRKYEIIRLGSDIYPVYREVPYQFISIEQPYSEFELSTKGMIFNARNAKSVSPIQRALPPYLQYCFVKAIQNRELSKYQGYIQSIDVDQIPDNLGKDVDGKPIRDKVATYLNILRKTSRDFYSGSQNSLGGLPPSTRSPGSSGFLLGTAVELLNLQNLLEYLKREISMAMGISPQRQSNFQTNTNVSDNQQAINQSYAITEPYFYGHSQIWRSALNEYIKNFRIYCKNQFEFHNQTELSFQYYLPDNTSEVLKITPNNLSHEDIGLVLVSSLSTEKYAQYMLQYAQAFAQNAGEGAAVISTIIKDIVLGSSPEEIHKRIQIEEKRQFERQSKLQEQQSSSQKELQQMQVEMRKDEQEHEIYLAKLEIEGKKEIALINSYMGKEDQDVNDNNVPDQLEILKLNQKVQLDSQKLELERKKLDHTIEYDKEKLQIEKKRGRPKKV